MTPWCVCLDFVVRGHGPYIIAGTDVVHTVKKTRAARCHVAMCHTQRESLVLLIHSRPAWVGSGSRQDTRLTAARGFAPALAALFPLRVSACAGAISGYANASASHWTLFRASPVDAHDLDDGPLALPPPPSPSALVRCIAAPILVGWKLLRPWCRCHQRAHSRSLRASSKSTHCGSTERVA